MTRIKDPSLLSELEILPQVWTDCTSIFYIALISMKFNIFLLAFSLFPFFNNLGKTSRQQLALKSNYSHIRLSDELENLNLSWSLMGRQAHLACRPKLWPTSPFTSNQNIQSSSVFLCLTFYPNIKKGSLAILSLYYAVTCNVCYPSLLKAKLSYPYMKNLGFKSFLTNVRLRC